MTKNLIPCNKELKHSAFIEYAHKPRILNKIWFIANYFYSLIESEYKEELVIESMAKTASSV